MALGPHQMVKAQDDPSPPRVWSIKIQGNETFEGIVLKNIISNESPSPLKKLLFWRKVGMLLDVNEVRRDVIRLQRFYQRRGFDDVIIDYQIITLSKPWRKQVVFKIVENQPIRIDDVQFIVQSSERDSSLISKDDQFSSIRKNLPYRMGQRYETVNKTEFEGKLVGVMRDLGYPYANSTLEAKIDSASKKASVRMIAVPGPRAQFDSVIVEGSENFPEKYIIRETGIKKGSLFSEKQLRVAQREIFNHHMLRFALINIPEQPEDSTINIKIRVKESPLRSFMVRFGMGNFTRIEDGWKDAYKLFRGRLSWTHRNVRHRGERFTISANASAIQQRFETDYLIPYFYNTKSSFIISPFAEHKLEPSYEIVRGGLVNTFIYQYSNNLTATASYEFTLNSESNKNTQESLPDSIDSYNVSSFNFNAFYSTTTRRSDQGWSFQPFWELSGLFGESTFSFQQTGFDLRKFTSLSDDIVFANRLNISGIYYAKQDSLPSDIRIYNGGTNSVRGWNRQELGPKRPIFDTNNEFLRFVPIGGRSTISFNAELRFRLNDLIKGFGVATFLDGGQVWKNFRDTGTTPLQYGAGAGFRYQSPIGPVRIDIAYKLNPTDQDLRIYEGQNYGSAWDRWGIHFSIGQAF